MWKVNITLLNNQRSERNNKELKKYFEINESVNTTYKNIWDTVKAVLRGKFIAVNNYIQNEEVSKVNNLGIYLKNLGKEEH